MNLLKIISKSSTVLCFLRKIEKSVYDNAIHSLKIISVITRFDETI